MMSRPLFVAAVMAFFTLACTGISLRAQAQEEVQKEVQKEVRKDAQNAVQMALQNKVKDNNAGLARCTQASGLHGIELPLALQHSIDRHWAGLAAAEVARHVKDTANHSLFSPPRQHVASSACLSAF